MASFIGREFEQKQLERLIIKKTASLAVVYGRRRIGKSRLIEHFGKPYRMLSFEGLAPREGMTMQNQLDAFSRQLSRQCKSSFKRHTEWGDALYDLSQRTKQGRIVILLDEISWMGLEDLDFLGKLKITWDKHFKKNPKLILFLCGSVSAWIKEHIISATGFHGRLSLSLQLRELPLNRCKYFWGRYKEKISNFEKLKFLCVTGGIPRYLEEIDPKLSAEENIRHLAFTESGILYNDYRNIFTDTLLRKSDVYEKIVRLLSSGPVESSEIPKKLALKSGGHLSSILNELTIAGFISKYPSWSLKDGKPAAISQYRLSDNYLRFYLKYIEPHIEQIMVGNFAQRSLTSLAGWVSIMSLQIENLVINNRAKIKEALSIKPEEIICDNPYFQRKTARQQGCQIDYLIQTKYNTLYICEVKYTRGVIRKYIIAEVEEKISRLKIPRNFSVRPVLIYAGNVHDEVMDADYFSGIINLETLFD